MQHAASELLVTTAKAIDYAQNVVEALGLAIDHAKAEGHDSLALASIREKVEAALETLIENRSRLVELEAVENEPAD